MKKLLTFMFGALFVTMTANNGCKPGGSGGGGVIAAIPDIANFELKYASTFVAGAASTISILSSSLGDGAFTVHFNLSGANTMSGLSAALNMSGGSGTFQTPALSTAGAMNINITSIDNSSGGTANITSNNTYAFSDSEGLMQATYTSGGTTTPFRGTHVIALITGNQLTVTGVVWTPTLTTIDLIDYLYTSAPATVNFNSNDLSFSGAGNNSTFNGNASYQASGTGTLINDGSAHGKIVVSTTSPLLTGSFSYTNQDSSTVVGTFSCPHP